jgi:hypothetical protein
MQGSGHAGNGGDTDTTGNQHGFGFAFSGSMQGEIILGTSHAQRIAYFQAVHEARTTRAVVFQAHAQTVTGRALCRVGVQRNQGIAAVIVQIRNLYLQVRTRRKRGQGTGLGRL